MSLNLLICSAGFGAIIIFSIIYLLIKKKISIKFALIWLILFVILLLAILIPGFLEWLMNIFGFQTPSNMVLTIFIAVLIGINIASTVAMSRYSKKISKLTQEIAILKGKKNK